jgi:hypothetical protein
MSGGKSEEMLEGQREVMGWRAASWREKIERWRG